MYRNIVKRLIDIVISLITLPILLLILSVVGILIKTEDRGPIFYKADRLGKNGVPFHMFKFRTMKVNVPDIRNEDGSTFCSGSDPRLTKIGKALRETSVDELPQLVNVLFGQMSLIGPRPDLVEMLSVYEGREVQKLDVVPGITGYNQAYFRNSISMRKRFENDVFYVDNLSFLLDVKIFFKTLHLLIQRKHVYNEENG
ncbi:UDP-phosphate galactose phosphotransferase [Sporosarcina ureae]|uniref:sugar transferase n=1 Tax=Sporosarcina ureae TaxID=1571 RepID=UPI000A14F800|nr:sugar transferase [Sporosarcina ureae]ARJ39630.1 UDP-phosphate galactose phosphotransferase [Sporosarcina ureae]